MRWPFTPSGSPASGGDDGGRSGSENKDAPPPAAATAATAAARTAVPPDGRKAVSWNDRLNSTDWEHFKEPRNWIPTVLVTATALASLHVYRSYLRRIPGVNHIQPGFFRRRSLFGRVTSVGDGDNFHLFHTPGGRLAGWGWLRKVPTDRKALKGRTIPVRIAGIDAPEGAHFGRPAQPFAAEALRWLSSYVLHRPVRARLYKRDQYDRVVATVHVRRLLGLVRRDVGLEMIRRGLATAYEAKSGAEFGGPATERRYRAAEAKARRKGVGMWSALAAQEKAGTRKRKGWLRWKEDEDEVVFETPREFKTRMRNSEADKEGKGEGQKTS